MGSNWTCPLLVLYIVDKIIMVNTMYFMSLIRFSIPVFFLSFLSVNGMADPFQLTENDDQQSRSSLQQLGNRDPSSRKTLTADEIRVARDEFEQRATQSEKPKINDQTVDLPESLIAKVKEDLRMTQDLSSFRIVPDAGSKTEALILHAATGDSGRSLFNFDPLAARLVKIAWTDAKIIVVAKDRKTAEGFYRQLVGENVSNIDKRV